MVLAQATSTYGIVQDRATLTLVLLNDIGTSVDVVGFESRDSKDLLNIRPEEKHRATQRTATIACASQIRGNKTGTLGLTVVHLLIETVILRVKHPG